MDGFLKRMNSYNLSYYAIRKIQGAWDRQCGCLLSRCVERKGEKCSGEVYCVIDWD